MKIHQDINEKSKKELLLSFMNRYSDIDECIRFFINIKFPEGFR